METERDKRKEETSVLSKTAQRDKGKSFVAGRGKSLGKNGNMTFAGLNDSAWKDGELKVQGKLAKYISNLRKQSASLSDKLQYSLLQKKKLKEKLSLCANVIQTMSKGRDRDRAQTNGRGGKKSFPINVV